MGCRSRQRRDMENWTDNGRERQELADSPKEQGGRPGDRWKRQEEKRCCFLCGSHLHIKKDCSQYRGPAGTAQQRFVCYWRMFCRCYSFIFYSVSLSLSFCFVVCTRISLFIFLRGYRKVLHGRFCTTLYILQEVVATFPQRFLFWFLFGLAGKPKPELSSFGSSPSASSGYMRNYRDKQVRSVSSDSL